MKKVVLQLFTKIIYLVAVFSISSFFQLGLYQKEYKPEE